MQRQRHARYVTWFIGAVLFGLLGAAAGSSLDETAIVAQVSAADHEMEEGYFTLGAGATVIAKPGSDLHRFLSSHRGQKVRLVIEGTRDGLGRDPSLRPDGGRDSGQISQAIPSASGGARSLRR
jgi:hypothetical protein